MNTTESQLKRLIEMLTQHDQLDISRKEEILEYLKTIDERLKRVEWILSQPVSRR